MRVLVIHNPASGRGRATRVGRRLAGALRAAGHEAQVLPIARGRSDEVLGGAARGADLLVVCGGDGSVRWAARGAVEHAVPIWHAPTGTENLFARGHATGIEPAALLRALERWDVRAVDVGECEGRLFLVMCSIGPDAGVIHRLHARRASSISHVSYAPPIVAELLRARTGPVEVDVDGCRVVDGERGILVIANTRHYAMRLDPAPHARDDDGLLDVVFLPGRGRAALLSWLVRCRRGRHLSAPGVVCAQGRAVRVRAEEGTAPAQIDGEAMFDAGGRARTGGTFEIGVRPGALRVLGGAGSGAASTARIPGT